MIKTLNTELPKALPNMRTVERFAYNVKPRSTDYIKYVREPKIEEVINRLQKMESRFEYKSRIYFVEIVDHEGAILYDECYFECIMELKKNFSVKKNYMENKTFQSLCTKTKRLFKSLHQLQRLLTGLSIKTISNLFRCLLSGLQSPELAETMELDTTVLNLNTAR
ncbi:Uncharacterized protein B5E38_5005 [Bacillus cereus]|nr:Uncharacterized protein B5E38_5005 [Bacillus cereus]